MGKLEHNNFRILNTDDICLFVSSIVLCMVRKRGQTTVSKAFVQHTLAFYKT